MCHGIFGVAADVLNGFDDHINSDITIQLLWNTPRIPGDNIIQLTPKL